MRVIAVSVLMLALNWAAPMVEAGGKKLPIASAISGRIVNGVAASEGQFPWQAGIMVQSAAGGSWCGGSIISDEWVLTAGHCVAGMTGADVYIGTTKISNPSKIIIKAAELIPHEDYYSTYLNNDIGLIRLASKITFNDNIRPVTLAKRDPAVGKQIVVSGWGLTSDTSVYISDVLYYTNVTTIENSACSSIYGKNVVTDNVICASTGDPQSSPCQGDSGAPVVIFDNCGTDVQVAVFSFTNGHGCEFDFPSGHTRVSRYRDWIKEKTGV